MKKYKFMLFVVMIMATILAGCSSGQSETKPATTPATKETTVEPSTTVSTTEASTTAPTETTTSPSTEEHSTTVEPTEATTTTTAPSAGTTTVVPEEIESLFEAFSYLIDKESPDFYWDELPVYLLFKDVDSDEGKYDLYAIPLPDDPALLFDWNDELFYENRNIIPRYMKDGELLFSRKGEIVKPTLRNGDHGRYIAFVEED